MKTKNYAIDQIPFHDLENIFMSLDENKFYFNNSSPIAFSVSSLFDYRYYYYLLLNLSSFLIFSDIKQYKMIVNISRSMMEYSLFKNINKKMLKIGVELHVWDGLEINQKYFYPLSRDIEEDLILIDSDAFISSPFDLTEITSQSKDKIYLFSIKDTDPIKTFFIRKCLSENFSEKKDFEYLKSWFNFVKVQRPDIFRSENDLIKKINVILNNEMWPHSNICSLPRSVLNDDLYKILCSFAKNCIKTSCDETVFIIYSILTDIPIGTFNNSIGIYNPLFDEVGVTKNRIIHFFGEGENNIFNKDIIKTIKIIRENL